MSGRKRGLGGGLLGQGAGSNVGEVLDQLRREGPAESVLVALVDPSPFQARHEASQCSVEDLAASIEESGLLQPILVRPTKNRYELLAGERRWRAFQHLRRERIPAHVREVDDLTAAIIGAVENLQRKNLGAWEEARAVGIVRAQLQTADEPSTVKELSRVFGWSAGKVSERLAIIEAFPEEVLDREQIDLHAVNELPKTALLKASRAPSFHERVGLLSVALGADVPGKAVAEADRPARGRPKAAFVFRAPRSGRISFHLRTPVEHLRPSEAQHLLDRLEPVLEALRMKTAT